MILTFRHLTYRRNVVSRAMHQQCSRQIPVNGGKLGELSPPLLLVHYRTFSWSRVIGEQRTTTLYNQRQEDYPFHISCIVIFGRRLILGATWNAESCSWIGPLVQVEINVVSEKVCASITVSLFQRNWSYKSHKWLIIVKPYFQRRFSLSSNSQFSAVQQGRARSLRIWLKWR